MNAPATALMSGNEAIARGAYEAGVTFCAGYPGTPATEIVEYMSTYESAVCEWSVNEKVAVEVGLGVALAGGRALVAMKHVGVNVASDPLFTAAYTGVKGGLVIVTADDPAMHSSQNEQDNRHFARAMHLPMLEPSDSEEARRFTRIAFAISEAHDTPVFIRSTTRLSHSKSVVFPAAPAVHVPSGFERCPEKYVMIPSHARRRREVLADRMGRLSEAADVSELNRVEAGGGGIGVITTGVSYTYVKEAAPDVAVLKLAWVHPLPTALIRRFARSVETLYVVEELDPFVELQVKAMGIDCIGKAVFPGLGELSPQLVRQGLRGGLPSAGTAAPDLPPRLPRLCPGCPHGNVFSALREMGLVVTGDIGCYTLGTLPPYEAIDTCVDMGGSLTMAQGIGVVEGPRSGRKVAAVIGDSTFAHAGIPGLLNACWNRRDGLFVVLDNGTTAMTGMQPNPLSGETLDRKEAPALDYAHLARAVGIPGENFGVVDAYDKTAVREALAALALKSGVRLLVVQGLCVIETRRLKKRGKLESRLESRCRRMDRKA